MGSSGDVDACCKWAGLGMRKLERVTQGQNHRGRPFSQKGSGELGRPKTQFEDVIFFRKRISKARGRLPAEGFRLSAYGADCQKFSLFEMCFVKSSWFVCLLVHIPYTLSPKIVRGPKSICSHPSPLFWAFVKSF